MTPADTPDDPRWDRLIHLVAGQVSDDEAAALRRWVAEDPERQEMLAQLEDLWAASARPDLEPAAWNAEAALRRIRETEKPARVIARVGPRFDPMRGPRSAARAVLRAAAAIAVMTGAGLLWWRLRDGGDGPPPPSAIAFTEYRTPTGQRLAFRLPDGTQVSLAPGSVLRQPSGYGVGQRTVQLEGEGFFTVAHDSTRPFAVHTARVVARDLGTRFLVLAYPEDAVTEVVVAEGIVAVGRASSSDPRARLSADSVVLGESQRATAKDSGRLLRAEDVDLDRYTSWTQGRLTFRVTPLAEVVRRIERWYGIEIRLAEPALGNRKLTATLEYESAPEAMDLIATSLELSLSRSGNTYLLALRS